MSVHEKINYVELPAHDLEKVKAFFTKAFSWKFTDYGSQYTAFTYSGIDGGFFKAPLSSKTQNGAALIVLYSENIQHSLDKVEQAGGKISKPIFEFPGGRRFHFQDPCDNEWAVWSL
ncbi:VOC family protein [Bermanella sp. WJH001]|uniref:VOC family protein n=1 Tax=Bermanella sp. WJH001 TaxID=3048005 RepID=UPI0024BE9F79|nr:VOC family protein [Bermanella sp. WJH001]MDJ1536753.1 VOC family protein [Bermanella sp. WJH001]